jgi:GGDEF domain-containing protein
LIWASVLAAAAYQCVLSGEWLLILMAGSSVASVIGAIASRNAGTPRYGIILDVHPDAALCGSTFELAQTTLKVGVSIGSASAPDDGVTADELLRSADRAMYEAK